MATIKEIAQKAGVSIGTVDRVLHNRGMVNEQTKTRIWEIVKELNYQPNHAAQGLAVRKKKLRLGFLAPETVGHPFFTDVLSAAVKKAKELEQFGVQVFFVELTSEDLDNEKYWEETKRQMEEMDGIVVIGLECPPIHEIVRKAADNQIPVVFYNLCFAEEEFFAYVGCDYEKAGRLAAGLCALAGGEDARVCVYSEFYNEDEENAAEDEVYLGRQNRLTGFQKEMKERYPNMKILDKRLLSDDQIDNYLSAIDMLKQYPDVNIVYVMNPGNYGICEAVNRADEKHQIRIITNDLVGKQIDMMQNGIISATVCQEPEKQGAQSLDLLFRYLAYGTIPDNKMCCTNLSIHIAQNI